jgi:phage shock protein PspC (stress-responsive transcriptional regulator)
MIDEKILGVCAWLSLKFDLDVGGIRLLFIVATILGLGSPILIYFVLYLLKPKGC